VILQKDKVIESLRIELAEAQLKIMEVDNAGGLNMQSLDKQLMDIKKANARLIEENDSFQFLLKNATLNGDISNHINATYDDVPSSDGPSGALESLTSSSLADELDLADDGEEGESENYRKVQLELKSTKEQNKALTAYINNILTRLLEHEDSAAILDRTPNLMKGPPAPSSKDKDLPPPPPGETTGGESFLSRTSSLLRRPRPVSQMPVSTNTKPSIHEDSTTAPSIPVGRSQSVRHNRSRSAQFSQADAAIINNYRAGDGISPGSGTPSRQSFFSPPINPGNPNAAARGIGESRSSSSTQAGSHRPSSPDTASGVSDASGEVNTPSPPQEGRTGGERSGSAGNMAPPKVPMGGKGMRPLRLVQENKKEADDVGSFPSFARNISSTWGASGPDDGKTTDKANKRQSFFGGLFGGGAAPPGAEGK
jgi:hypothetical protein